MHFYFLSYVDYNLVVCICIPRKFFIFIFMRKIFFKDLLPGRHRSIFWEIITYAQVQYSLTNFPVSFWEIITYEQVQ